MITIPVYNKDGKKEKDMELDPHVFGVVPQESVVHQVYVAQMANARGVYAHTKGKGDVAGGGRKPWRQKGTGRARHGSIRSPLWRGGGVTFGPTKERNYKQKINKKMRLLATKMCLSDKVKEEKFVVVEALSALEPKTREFARLIKALPLSGTTILFLTQPGQEMVVRSLRNMKRVEIERVQEVTVTDLLNHQFVLTTPECVEALTKRLKK